MEELLLKIEKSLATEASQALTAIPQRIAELKEYLKLLEAATGKIKEVSTSYKHEVTSVIAEKSDHEKGLAKLREDHSNEIKTHDLKISDKQSHIEKLNVEISDKELKQTSYNNLIDGLMSEGKNLESSIFNLKGNKSSLERENRDLEQNKKSLVDSIEIKKKEEALLVDSIEKDKKEFSQLSNDLAVLKARA